MALIVKNPPFAIYSTLPLNNRHSSFPRLLCNKQQYSTANIHFQRPLPNKHCATDSQKTGIHNNYGSEGDALTTKTFSRLPLKKDFSSDGLKNEQDPLITCVSTAQKTRQLFLPDSGTFVRGVNTEIISSDSHEVEEVKSASRKLSDKFGVY